MTNTYEYLGHPSTIPNEQARKTSNQMDYHCFNVYCLSKNETLTGKIYNSVDDIKKDTFAIYKDGGFNDDNAILTYFDDKNVEVLLTSVPDLPKKDDSKDLFIRFV